MPGACEMGHMAWIEFRIMCDYKMMKIMVLGEFLELWVVMLVVVAGEYIKIYQMKLKTYGVGHRAIESFLRARFAPLRPASGSLG
jgi:hypothetical protein